MVMYKQRYKDFPDSSTGLFCEIESTVEYLIQLVDQHKLNMTQILNHKAMDGRTLFWVAADFSEKVANMLIQKNEVKVNTVDDKFMIPPFRVSNAFLIAYQFEI